MKNVCDEHTDNAKDIPKSPLLTSVRLWTSILVMVGATLLVINRMSLSMAIVCMVKYGPDEDSVVYLETVPEINNGSSSSEAISTNATDGNYGDRVSLPCADSKLLVHDGEREKTKHIGTFDWDKKIQGYLLSSYFYGFFPGIVLGGYACDRWGGRQMMMISVGGSALLCLLHPVAAYAHYVALIVVRILVGGVTGIGLSCPPNLMSRWGSPADLGLLLGIVYTGFPFGTMITHPLVSNLCIYGPFGGWPSAYYTMTIMGGIWLVISFFFLHDKPASHPFITDSEIKYLQVGGKDAGNTHTEIRPLEWRRLLTSNPIWVSFWTLVLCSTGYFTFVLHQPIFMRDLFGFPTDQNGWMSSLPWVTELPVSLAIGAAVDKMKMKGITTTTIRKIFNSLGYTTAVLVPVIAVEASCEQKWLAATFLIMAEVGNCVAFVGGCFYIAVDLAPAYSSTIFGILNSGLSCCGIMTPMLVAYLTPKGTRDEWRRVFWVAALSNCCGVLLFLFFGSAKAEPWATWENSMSSKKDPANVPLIDKKDKENFKRKFSDEEHQEENSSKKPRDILSNSKRSSIATIDMDSGDSNSNNYLITCKPVNTSNISIEIYSTSEVSIRNNSNMGEGDDSDTKISRSVNVDNIHRGIRNTDSESSNITSSESNKSRNFPETTVTIHHQANKGDKSSESKHKYAIPKKNDKTSKNKPSGLRKVKSEIPNCESNNFTKYQNSRHSIGNLSNFDGISPITISVTV